MSENKRSYFSTIPGLATGLAGVLTAIVGLITVLIQLDVIGGDDTNGSTAGNAGATTTTTTAESGTFTVSPTALEFGPTDLKEKILTIKNTSSVTTLTVQTPKWWGQTTTGSPPSRTAARAPWRHP